MKLSLYQYRFPFKQTFRTSSGSYSVRKGIYLQLEDQHIQAVGEAAPLPGFSRESHSEVLHFAAEHASKITSFVREQASSQKSEWTDFSPVSPPSLAFALHSLIADYRAKQQHCTLQDLLFERSANSLPVNATLPMDTVEKSLVQAGKLWKRGFRTLKLKVGNNFEYELSLLKRVRSTLPDAVLRIDANQGWELEEAIENLQTLEGLDIQYCEEPISNPTTSALHKVRAATDIPIAIDESLYKHADPSHWITEQVGDYIIIKPMIIGAFNKIFETCSLADDHDYATVFTTALESGIGRWMTTVLASGLGSSGLAHGLATGHHLAKDVCQDDAFVQHGTLNLPGGPGCTVKLLPEEPGVAIKKLDLF